MTFLSASEIYGAIEIGSIKLEPFEPILVKPASVILRMGNRWRRWKELSEPLDIWSSNAAENNLEEIESRDEFQLSPGEFVLGATLERISISHDLLGIISTLSHLARFGLSAQLNSFLVNPGFGSESPTALALELTSSNKTPLILRAGLPVCHLAFAHVSQNTLSLEDNSFSKSIYEGRDPLGLPLLFEEYASNVKL